MLKIMRALARSISGWDVADALYEARKLTP